MTIVALSNLRFLDLGYSGPTGSFSTAGPLLATALPNLVSFNLNDNRFSGMLLELVFILC